MSTRHYIYASANPAEAHPFLTRPTARPGSSRLWPGPPPAPDLGVRAQGTDVQKWARLAVVDSLRARYRRVRLPNGDGQETELRLLPEGQVARPQGGKGMGGGGGRPGERPQPPDSFLQRGGG